MIKGENIQAHTAKRERNNPHWRRVMTALGAVGAAMAFGSFSPSIDNSESSDPSVQQAVTQSTESFATQIVNDYEHAGPREKLVQALPRTNGNNGGEYIVLTYSAKDLTTHKTGGYQLEVDLSKDSHGKINPHDAKTIQSIAVDEELGPGVTSGPIYQYTVGQQDAGKYWSVGLVVSQLPTYHPDNYTYTTGKPKPGVSSLPYSNFETIVDQAQSILKAAPEHTSYTLPAVAFPPPAYNPNPNQ